MGKQDAINQKKKWDAQSIIDKAILYTNMKRDSKEDAKQYLEKLEFVTKKYMSDYEQWDFNKSE